MTFWNKYKPYILQIALALAVGGLSALLSGSQAAYATLTKPPLSPPGWVFPVVWTVLYVLMGVAAGLVVTSGDRGTGDAMRWYYVQLGLNLLWSPIFFRFGWLTVAAVWLALLVVAVWITRQKFAAIRPLAGALLTPYLLWCLFALYLNIGFAILN